MGERREQCEGREEKREQLWARNGRGGGHLVTRVRQEYGGLIFLDQTDLRIWIAHFFLTHEAWHSQLSALRVRDFCAGHLEKKEVGSWEQEIGTNIGHYKKWPLFVDIFKSSTHKTYYVPKN
jgi:hypothetical protein